MLRAWSTIKKSQKGFSAVEVLLAATLFGFLVIAVSGAIIYGRGSLASAGERQRATQIADEGVEVARNLRDNSYANLADGTHGLAQSGGQWVFSGTSDTSGIFTRQLSISTINGSRKSVTVTVSWPQGAGTSQITVTTELTNWGALFSSWFGATLAGSYDANGTCDALKAASKSHFVYLVRTGSCSPNFLIIDIATPATPILAGSLTLPGSLTNISINNNNAYITNAIYANMLQIVDVSKSSAPSLTTTISGSKCDTKSGGTAGALSVSTTTSNTYITRAANGGNAEFCILDNKNNNVVGAFSLNVNMYAIFISGNDAYVTTNSATQEVIDFNIKNANKPTITQSVDLPGANPALAINGYGSVLLVGQGSTLYSLTVTSGVVSQPPVGSVATSGAGVINDIAIDPTNTYVFLATNAATAQFQVVNAGNLASMTVIRTVAVSGVLNGLNYVSSIDAVAAASSSDTQELMLFLKN